MLAAAIFISIDPMAKAAPAEGISARVGNEMMPILIGHVAASVTRGSRSRF